MLCTCTLISAYSSYLYTHSVNTVEFLTVDETAKEPPQEESGINSPQGLALEATYINQSLSQQMLVVVFTVTMVACLYEYNYSQQQVVRGCSHSEILIHFLMILKDYREDYHL